MAKTTVDTLLIKIQADMAQLERELQKVQGKTQQASKKMSASFKRFDEALGRAIKRTALVGGAIGVAFGTVAIRKIVQTGSSIESLQIRLKQLFGSADEGKKAFDVLAEFASKVPFSLAEIQQGAGSLAVVSKNAEDLRKNLEITGNAAALTGLDFATASAQIQRAFAGGAAASDLFRERGLNALLGFKAGASSTAEETAKIFEENLGANGKFGKTTDELASTLSGTLSMIGDKVFNFQKIIADEGFFEKYKEQFQKLDKILADNQEQIEQLGQELSITLVKAVELTVQTLAFLNENLEELKTILTAIAGLAGLKILKDLLVGLGVVGGSKQFLKFFKLLPKQLQIAIGGAAALGLAIKGIGMAMEESTEKGKRFVGLINQINPELKTMGGGDILKGRPRPDIVANPRQEDELGVFEKSPQEIAFEEANKDLKEQIRLFNIRDEKERDFQELLLSAGIGSESVQAQQLRAVFMELKNLEEAEDERIQKQKDATKRVEDRIAKEDELKDIIQSTRTEEERLNDELREFKELAEELGMDTMPEFKEAYERLKGEIESLNPVVRILEDNFDRAFDGIAQAIADSMTEGKNALESFKSVALNIINSLIKDFVKLQFAQTRATSGGGGGSLIGDILGGIGDIFGGGKVGFPPIVTPTIPTPTASFMMGGSMSGRAGGGAVSPRIPTLVGERGAELFVPNTSGRIVNNANMKGMGGNTTVINQSINVETGVAQTVRAEMLNLLPQFKAETIGAVAESRLRGGEFASAFSGGK
tara:strand:- start:1928 stop:4225 length:2298 start_codon:yes stop_codon:yes gene_type:complete